MNEYSLEFLIEIFEEHAIQWEMDRKKRMDNFLENNPGETLPDYLKGDFNISKALGCICEELLKLKKRQ